MSVSTTMTRFATVWQNFSGDAAGQRIEHAYPVIPRIIHAAHLPCVVIFPGNATYNYDRFGESVVSETRTYRCVVAVAQATFGNMETGEAGVEPYFSAVRDYFAARPGLEDDTESAPRTVLWMSRIISDTGYFIFEYPAGLADGEGLGLFHAVEFTFEITENAKITYKD